MGILFQGILGGFSGKVGPVVGAKWKDIDYMRGYVVPSNPNTPGQQAARTKFKSMVAIARVLLPSVLQPFWDPFLSNMSGFNSFISKNYPLSDTDGKIDETAIISRGSLQAVPNITATYNNADGAVSVSWNAALVGNGEAGDLVYMLALNKSTQELFISGSQAVRADGGDEFTITSGLTTTDIIVFVFFYRGTGSELIVSDSVSDISSAP